MPFLLLLLLALTCLPVAWPEPPDWLGEGGSILVTWTGIFLLGLMTAVVTWRCRRRILVEPESRYTLLKRFNTFRKRHMLVLMGYYLVALFSLGWGYTLQARWPGHPQHIPGMQLLLLAPFFAGLVTSWLCFYHVEKIAHDQLALSQPFPGLWSYLGLQMRHNLLLVVPPLFLLLFEQGLFFVFPQLQESDALLPFLAIGLMGVAFLSIPLLLRYFLGLKPMPPCPLRDRLEAAAKRMGFRFSNILVWDTRNNIANAMVTGIFPWMRYIVVTDRLVHELTHEEMEAVFGHEVGHVRHHHMLFYILFLLGSVVMLSTLGQIVLDLLRSETFHNWFGGLAPMIVGLIESNEVFVMAPLLGVMAIYIFIFFGYLSRRCERQADVYGAKATSCQDFINALEKVAYLNGIPREKPGWLSCWQHGTIAQRVEFMERMKADPALATDFQRRIGVLKWSMALGLVGFFSLSLLFLGADRVWEILKTM